MYAQNEIPGVIPSFNNSVIINSDRAANPLSSISRISTTKNRIGIEYSNPYLLKDLHSGSIFGSYQFKWICLGTRFSIMGNDYLQTYNQELTLAKLLAKKISIGVGFSHTFINQPNEYPDMHFYSPSMGLSFAPSDKFRLSSCLKNIAISNQHVQQEFIIAFSYIIKSLSLHCQLEKYWDEKTFVDFAGEYKFKKIATVFIKTSTGKTPFCVGAEFVIAKTNISIDFSYHKYLGTTPGTDFYKEW